MWLLCCDGSAAPNPGRIGIGVVLCGPGGEETILSHELEERGDNNEAEVRALIAGLWEARRQGATALRVHCDSDVVVEHVGRGVTSRVQRLEALYVEARTLLAGFADVELLLVTRRNNAVADGLARAALGLSPKAAPRPRRRR